MDTPVTNVPENEQSDELNFNKAMALTGLQPQYFRKLTVTGKIPAHKNENGHWRYSKAELEAWKANRGTGRARATKDGRTNFLVRATAQEAEAINKALPENLKLVKAWTTRPKSAKKAKQPKASPEEMAAAVQAVAVKATPIGRTVPQQPKPLKPAG